ncbi:ribonuclease [Aquibium sp. LZ166]|uniref:Ribonuclease n=1 Tax=Aquibium pacificus TaxID=3153579 RepID=A0ABV3SEV7_9HYPH
MRAFGLQAFAVLIVLFPSATRAEVRLEGWFIAEQECAATQSIRTGANPGGVTTEVRHAYDMLAGNKESPSHYLIRVPGAEPERRWVAAGCGVHAVAAKSSPTPPDNGGGGQPQRVDFVLAASWQPGFCETRPDKTECTTQTNGRFDASNFSLHGLWPQPRSNVYCQVAPDVAADDKAGRWEALPEVTLDGDTRSELDKVMPGTASLLERHEWVKHGTCYGDTMEEYFADSLAIMSDLNASAARELFAENVGATLTAVQIREAFDASFGPGAGSRVRVSCVTDPSNGRRLIGEITIGLSGEIDDEANLSDLIFAATPTDDAGCTQGIVDAAGLQ